jgi:hypothetical protein
MRCIVLVRATRDSENGVMPSPELLAAMGNYNEELLKAGIMLGGWRLASNVPRNARALFRR